MARDYRSAAVGMYWRPPRAQFPAQKGEGTKQAFQQVVESGEIV
jgi:hypothetical protein